jgi:hypothetical protein
MTNPEEIEHGWYGCDGLVRIRKTKEKNILATNEHEYREEKNRLNRR